MHFPFNQAPCSCLWCLYCLSRPCCRWRLCPCPCLCPKSCLSCPSGHLTKHSLKKRFSDVYIHLCFKISRGAERNDPKWHGMAWRSLVHRNPLLRSACLCHSLRAIECRHRQLFQCAKFHGHNILSENVRFATPPELQGSASARQNAKPKLSSRSPCSLLPLPPLPPLPFSCGTESVSESCRSSCEDPGALRPPLSTFTVCC